MAEQLEILKTGAAALSLRLDDRQLDMFQAYYELLVEWNERINLTAITDYEQVQVRHFLDSLTLAAALYQLESAEAEVRLQPPAILQSKVGKGIIDLGTGAGFPGLSLKILWPAVEVALVDSVGKKTNFLREIVSKLELSDVDVITGRAEELGQNKAHRGRYDLVTARAVAALPVLAEYGLPLCRVGGLMLAPKKGDIGAELEAARRAVTKLGGREVQALPFLLPGDAESRQVVMLPKVAPTPNMFPRAVGLAAKKPLGET